MYRISHLVKYGQQTTFSIILLSNQFCCHPCQFPRWPLQFTAPSMSPQLFYISYTEQLFGNFDKHAAHVLLPGGLELVLRVHKDEIHLHPWKNSVQIPREVFGVVHQGLAPHSVSASDRITQWRIIFFMLSVNHRAAAARRDAGTLTSWMSRRHTSSMYMALA